MNGPPMLGPGAPGSISISINREAADIIPAVRFPEESKAVFLDNPLNVGGQAAIFRTRIPIYDSNNRRILHNGQLVAVKVYKIIAEDEIRQLSPGGYEMAWSGSQGYKEFKNELAILRALRRVDGIMHPKGQTVVENLTVNFGSNDGLFKGCVALIFHNLEQGDLDDFIDKSIAGPKVDEFFLPQDVFANGRVILSIVQKIKEEGVEHRDIKAANVLMSGHNVKVTDFGLSRFLDPKRRGFWDKQDDICGTEGSTSDLIWIGAKDPLAENHCCGVILQKMMLPQVSWVLPPDEPVQSGRHWIKVAVEAGANATFRRGVPACSMLSYILGTNVAAASTSQIQPIVVEMQSYYANNYQDLGGCQLSGHHAVVHRLTLEETDDYLKRLSDTFNIQGLQELDIRQLASEPLHRAAAAAANAFRSLQQRMKIQTDIYGNLLPYGAQNVNPDPLLYDAQKLFFTSKDPFVSAARAQYFALCKEESIDRATAVIEAYKEKDAELHRAYKAVVAGGGDGAIKAMGKALEEASEAGKALINPREKLEVPVGLQILDGILASKQPQQELEDQQQVQEQECLLALQMVLGAGLVSAEPPEPLAVPSVAANAELIEAAPAVAGDALQAPSTAVSADAAELLMGLGVGLAAQQAPHFGPPAMSAAAAVAGAALVGAALEPSGEEETLSEAAGGLVAAANALQPLSRGTPETLEVGLASSGAAAAAPAAAFAAALAPSVTVQASLPTTSVRDQTRRQTVAVSKAIVPKAADEYYKAWNTIGDKLEKESKGLNAKVVSVAVSSMWNGLPEDLEIALTDLGLDDRKVRSALRFSVDFMKNAAADAAKRNAPIFDPYFAVTAPGGTQSLLFCISGGNRSFKLFVARHSVLSLHANIAERQIWKEFAAANKDARKTDKVKQKIVIAACRLSTKEESNAAVE